LECYRFTTIAPFHCHQGFIQVDFVLLDVLAAICQTQLEVILNLLFRYEGERRSWQTEYSCIECKFVGKDKNEQTGEYAQCRRVNHRSRTKQLVWLPLKPILTGVSNQAPGLASFLHDIFASIDALRAVDAFELKTISNVDTGWTDSRASTTLDATTYRDFCEPIKRKRLTLPFLSRFTSIRIVGHDQRLSIEHHRLKSSVRTCD
jgi:hypothetical protein